MRAAAELESDAFVLQKTPHAAGGFEAERAAAGENDGVNAVGDVHAD